MENGVCLQQTETENGSLFSLVGKRQTTIDDSFFGKRAHLWLSLASTVSSSVE
jgi:hypothetical protein